MWPSKKGFTLVEFMIAAGIGVGIILGASFFLTKSFKTSNKTNALVLDTSESDLGLQTFIDQVQKSEIMRSGIIDCGNDNTTNTLLHNGKYNGDIDLKNTNDELRFAYFKSRSVGVSDVDDSASILVPEVSSYPIGSIVAISTLEISNQRGIYVVSRVGSSTNPNSIKLKNISLSIPSEFNCSVTNSPDPGSIFRKGESRQFSIGNLKFVRYFKNSGGKLMATSWPIPSKNGTTPGAVTRVVYENFDELTLHQEFTKLGVSSATQEAGLFKLSGKFLYKKTQDAQKQSFGIISSGYEIHGSVVSNAQALVQTSDPETIFPSCSIIAQKLPGSFQIQGNYYSNLYRVFGNITEFDYFKTNALEPSISVSIDPMISSSVTCWDENNINFIDCDPYNNINAAATLTKYNNPVTVFLRGNIVTPESFTVLRNCLPPVDSFHFAPVLCNFNNGPTLINGIMTYTSIVNSNFTQNQKACTSANIGEPITAINFKFKDTPSCEKSGSVSKGKLVLHSDESIAGPPLFVKQCKWSSSGLWTTCDLPTIMSGSSSPITLVAVKFSPEKLTINGAQTNMIFYCH